MPAHYALSDAAIVLVAAWAAPALWLNRKILPAVAMACFGFAASIGVVRFGADLQAELAAVHAAGSLVLGLAAALMLAAACFWHHSQRRQGYLAFAALAAAAGTYFVAPTFIGPLFVLALTGALLVRIVQVFRSGSSWFGPAGLTILLLDTLLIRRAPWLAEASAWHAYHLLIALGMLALTRVDLHDRAQST